MFGTSGIRGIYGADVTEELAQRISNLFARGELQLGRDTRRSGPSLLKAVSEGAIFAGADVVDLGIAPTPTVALAAKDGRGIMITASHNPEEYNGLKLIERSKEIGKPLERRITEDYQNGIVREGARGVVRSDAGMIERHISLIESLVDAPLISRRKPKIIVDCNGAAHTITPRLLTELGCRVVPLNCQAEGFARPSEPHERNLPYMKALILKEEADFAIAHDGDGDRCVIFDERGEMLPFDAQLAMMISHELGIGDARRIVSTVEASLTIRQAVEDEGGEIDITPVGSTFVADRMEEIGALFGGEPCGEYIYKDGVHVPDAVLAAAKFAQIFCEEGDFSELKTRYPQHHMARERFQSDDKRSAMERIKEAVRGLGIDGEVRDDDGIRIDEADGWFLIRASGTEPIVRLTMEYLDQTRLERRKRTMIGLIENHI